MDGAAVKLEARGQVERCPYCHDLAGVADALVTCAGCGTTHHAECVAELGRCTVLGCERPLVAPEGRAPSRTVREQVRRRYQERAQVLAPRIGTRVEAADATLPLRLALEALREAEASCARTLLAQPVVEALGVVLEHEERLGGGADRDDIPGWLPLAQLRERLAESERAVARDEREREVLLFLIAGAGALITAALAYVLWLSLR